MGLVQESHFGGNIVLINDSAKDGSPFREMLKEINFTNFRYPGGTVTEKHTWENGGLQKIFGDPMAAGGDDYVMTMREALELSVETGATMTVVVPTFQFFNKSSHSFDSKGFNLYVSELEKALLEYPDAKVTGFEIGNEYWSEIDAADYGFIANKQIPLLDKLSDRLQSKFDEAWVRPDIGIQAGAAWKASGEKESLDIASKISTANRELVDVIHQHAYPNPHRGLEWQKDWAINPANVFKDIAGFSSDLKVSLSEFNIGRAPGESPVYGVNQGSLWIEELSRYIDAGVDSIDHWGLNYNWLTNKFYDKQIPWAESDGGKISTIATPMGQVYDLARSHLLGKSTMSDVAAIEGIKIDGDLGITGFEDAGQRVLFLSNMSGKDAVIDFADLVGGKSVIAHHIVAADSPATPWYDESTMILEEGQKIDARGDMKVLSGDALGSGMTLGANQLLMLLITDDDRGLVLEGAHNVTDPTTGMVDDIIVGGKGNDILRGHVGDDTLIGGGGNDVLIGGKGADLLMGGDGDDVLISDVGSDRVEAGDGNDVVLIASTDSPNEDVVSVSTGQGDDQVLIGGGRDVVIDDFMDGDMLGFAGAFADRDSLIGAIKVDGEDLLVSLPDGGVVTLLGGWIFAEDLDQRVLDFLPDDQIQARIDDVRNDMTEDQWEEVVPFYYDLLEPSVAERIKWYDDEGAQGDSFHLQLLQKPRDPDVSESEEDELDWLPSEPLPDEDYDQDHEDQLAEDHSGGGCFVATAAYGDPGHPDVKALRAFRDNHLVYYRSGRFFIRLYWWLGPKLASVTTPYAPHGQACRWFLGRVVQSLRRIGYNI